MKDPYLEKMVAFNEMLTKAVECGIISKPVDVVFNSEMEMNSVRVFASPFFFVEDLKDKFSEQAPLSTEAFYFKFNGKALSDETPVSSFINFASSSSEPTRLDLHLRLLGGAKNSVIKPHVKRDVALKNLVKKTVANASKKLPEFETNGQMPDALRHLLEPIINKMNETKARSINENIFSDALEALPDDKLKDLSKIFEKVSGCVADEKIIQTSYVFLSELSMLDESVEHIRKVQHDIIASFIETFANNYNTTRSGDVVFANSQFASDVSEVISYRKRLRNRPQDQTIEEPAEGSGSRCSVM